MKKIKCWLGNHKLIRLRRIGYSMIIHCTNCNGTWGMNHSVRAVLPFDDEMYSMYLSMDKSMKKLEKYISYKGFHWFFPF